jgi:hypothetical protein
MPRHKDLKRLVRARMSKTGESYTAARAHVLAKSSATPRTTALRAAESRKTSVSRAPRPNYAELAGYSDDVLRAKTGCTWERWVGVLDYFGADKMVHRDIAALVHKKFKIEGWWSQAVTVGYERIKGLRARGQRRDGSYEANKSRTYNVPVETLFAAWADARKRGRWLDGEIGKVRTSTAAKSMRLDGRERSIVAVGFWPKGPSKSAVSVQHTKLRDQETATKLKKYWGERLDALRDVLTSA